MSRLINIGKNTSVGTKILLFVLACLLMAVTATFLLTTTRYNSFLDGQSLTQ